MEQKNGIFSREYRAFTIAVIAAVTAVGFEGLAVTTVAPVITEQLGGVSLYGWIFSAYMLAQIIGAVVIGEQSDRHGPAWPFAAAIMLFAAGLVAAAVAWNMPVLIAGRALQGFGAGAMLTCVYTGITLRYDNRLRMDMLAVFSGSYIIPTLIGPYIAGVAAEHASWRGVFWGILPLLAAAAALGLPQMQKLRTAERPPASGSGKTWLAIRLAAGAGMLLAGLALLPGYGGALLAVAGLLILLPPLRSLLPAGTFAARTGLPSAIASRGLIIACYYGTESFLVLALTAVQGYSAEAAGLIVAAASLSWSIAAWMQSRFDNRDGGWGRRRRVMLGVALMLIGTAAVVPVVWLPSGALLLAAIGQIVAGFGNGLAHPTSGAIALGYAERGKEGEVSATLQFADAFTPAVSIGIGGAIVAVGYAAGWLNTAGIAAALCLQLLQILLGLYAAYRLPSEPSAE